MSEESRRLAMLTEVHTDVKWIKEAMQRGQSKLEDHDRRLRSLEGWRKWSAGLWIGIGALLGFGSGHLPKL